MSAGLLEEPCMSSNTARRWLAYLPLLAVIVVPFIIDFAALAADSSGAAAAATPKPSKPTFLENLLPIAILLVVIGIVFLRLPKVELGHSKEYRARRAKNWLPLGLTYSFLYMARYNLTTYKNAAHMDTDDFSIIFMVGTITYGLSFLINGPLTDKLGGRATIIISAVGTALVNVIMGLAVAGGWSADMTPLFAVLYAANMYFQSFGAVSIVKVNAPWFHVRERGTFSAIFGILISLGIYFAYDWGKIIVDNLPFEWVFLLPAAILMVFAFLDVLWVRDRPALAGFSDFDPGDAKVGEDGPRLNVWRVFALMFSQRVILIISLIEFCSGFLRQSIMQYGKIYAETVGKKADFVFANWGVFTCCAGILGGIFAGVISDHLFQSRRGPVTAVLYGVMVAGGVVTLFTYETSFIGPVTVLMSMAVIGVHGMLSGTASMDFGGRQNTGIAVGIIDGFVYLGTGTMALINAYMLPSVYKPTASTPEEWNKMFVSIFEAAVPANWTPLFISMIPVALIGLGLSLRLWNAKPQRAAAAAH